MTNEQKIAHHENRINTLKGRNGVPNGRIVAKIKRRIRALKNQ